MNSWLDQFAFFMSGAMLLLTGLGLALAALMPGMDRWSKRFFIIFFSVFVALMSSFLADEIIYLNQLSPLLGKVVAYFEYLLMSILMSMIMVYQLHCCGENWRASPLFIAVVALWSFYFILLVIAQFTTCFYYITPEDEYIRAPWHPLLMAPINGILILTLTALIRRRNRLSGKRFFALLVYLAPLTIGIFIHSFVYIPLFVDAAIALCGFSMFAIILLDEIEQYMRHQREIAHQHASILVLQMRPHFIYNTMMSIYYLCKQNPDLAQQVTMDFTTYLRKNSTAIASEKPIPFSEELEHTRAYLAVEQAQFDDRLFVDYDTPHTQFHVPPLTLQPIVENAVKHGMDPDSEPLHISIKTRETDSGSEIIVEDNGPGFEPADDNEPHIALANIQQRLEMMCGGKLTITPRNGGGTVVKVTIP